MRMPLESRIAKGPDQFDEKLGRPIAKIIGNPITRLFRGLSSTCRRILKPAEIRVAAAGKNNPPMTEEGVKAKRAPILGMNPKMMKNTPAIMIGT